MNPVTVLCILILIAGFSASANAQDEETQTSAFSYGEQGLQYESSDGLNFLWFGVRLQTRASNSAIRQDEIPGNPTDRNRDFKINRGRLKLGGHLVSPAFTVYTEYDFSTDTLLDLRATYEFASWLSIRAGQWKSEFNRERIDSSGKQQFADRSILTPWFTIDRQKGLMASGRFAEGQTWDSSYWFGRVSGAGRGGDIEDADGMWLARYQWNFSGRVLPFSQSNLSKRDSPAGSVAFAFVSGNSAYTSFSSNGGGQLPGYVDGRPDQYQIQQMLAETAWQGHGFSWQQELHWKSIEDRVNGTDRKLLGIYVQAGMFFSEVWDAVPEPLEFAARFAYIDLDRGLSGDREWEFSVAANWFFNGHRNKLTTDLAYINRQMASETDTHVRFRLQWEWSF